MTIHELAKLRRLRAKPAFPVVLTNVEDVRQFCVSNDLPFLWLPAFRDDTDLRPLHGLDCWFIYTPEGLKNLGDRIREQRPASMWVAGPYGFDHRIRQAVGRSIWN